MKNFTTHLFLVLSLIILAGCEADPTPDDPTCKYSKSYNIKIGTYINDFNRPQSNPTGSVSIKKADGSIQLIPKKDVSISVSGVYLVDGPTGKYKRNIGATKTVTLDREADFAVYFSNIASTLNGPSDTVVNITKIQVTMTAIIEGATYQKNYSFSNDSLWDITTGLSLLFNDLQITEIENKLIEYPTTCVRERVLDIDEDIVLLPIPATTAKTLRK